MRIRKWLVVFTVLFALAALQVSAAESQIDVVGQVVSPGARLDGVLVPSGATILESSVLYTESNPAVIHLSDGQTLELSRNSEVYFERAGDRTVRATVRSGTLSFRSSDGTVAVAPPTGQLAISATGIQAVTSLVHGTVAVLMESATLGQSVLKVNDTGRINPGKAILIKVNAEDPGEVHYVTQMEDTSVVTTAGLGRDFAANSLIVQDDEQIAKAVATGAAVVGASAAAAGGGLTSGTILGVSGAAAGTAAGVGSLLGEDEQTQVQSGTTPPR